MLIASINLGNSSLVNKGFLSLDYPPKENSPFFFFFFLWDRVLKSPPLIRIQSSELIPNCTNTSCFHCYSNATICNRL